MAKILIVDDDEMERLLERHILEGLGHTLLFASDGDSALSVFKRGEIDLVITDLAMPELNGLRLIQEIKEMDSDARIIAVSGASADQLHIAERMGAFCTLFKPLQQSELLAAVEQALRNRRSAADPWGSAKG
jgi:CheY-like chemotaxis protein